MSNVTCYAYDALHRLTAKTYPSGTYASVTPQAHYVYDAATVNGVAMANAKGRLAEAYTSSSTGTKITDIGLSYSSRGEITDRYQSSPNSQGYYHTSKTFWDDGLTKTISTNMSGVPIWSIVPDGEGRVSAVSASSGQNPVTATIYNPAGKVLAVGFGSADSDSYAYDPNTNRVTQFTFKVSSTTETGALGWNANGTLGSLKVNDGFTYGYNTQNCNFSYDDLSRILNVCENGVTVSYDPFGNILNWGATAYNSSTNRMTSYGSASPSYDGNGNLTNDGASNAFTWDAEGHNVQFNWLSETIQKTQDALGETLESGINNGNHYVRLFTPEGHEIGHVLAGQAYARLDLPAGASVDYFTGTGYTLPNAYYHSDWLGTAWLESTTTRTVKCENEFEGFGILSIGGCDAELTGSAWDNDNAYVWNFPARDYSNSQARWITPDPAGLSAVDPSDPQTWNRYAYARNNPLLYTDPTGTSFRSWLSSAWNWLKGSSDETDDDSEDDNSEDDSSFTYPCPYCDFRVTATGRAPNKKPTKLPLVPQKYCTSGAGSLAQNSTDDGNGLTSSTLLGAGSYSATYDPANSIASVSGQAAATTLAINNNGGYLSGSDSFKMFSVSGNGSVTGSGFNAGGLLTVFASTAALTIGPVTVTGGFNAVGLGANLHADLNSGFGAGLTAGVGASLDLSWGKYRLPTITRTANCDLGSTK